MLAGPSPALVRGRSGDVPRGACQGPGQGRGATTPGPFDGKFGHWAGWWAGKSRSRPVGRAGPAIAPLPSA
jgi:hypothetical protein